MRAVSVSCWGLLIAASSAQFISGQTIGPSLRNLTSGEQALVSAAIADVPPPIPSPKVRELVAQILDDRLPVPKRQELIQKNAKLAAELISGMTDELTTGGQEEVRRIPWLWRIAIGAGKGNDPQIIRDILNEALPEPNQVLHDWRAAVVGGGIINGIGQLGLWPRERMQEILNGQEALLLRWNMAIVEAVKVAEDERETFGARYDAMRMLGLGTWNPHGRQLERYLQPGVPPDLQMGAISGLADMDHADAVTALIRGLVNFSEKNRNLAIAGLLHGEVRQKTFIEALEQGLIQPTWVTLEHRDRLFGIADATWRQRAEKVFKK